MGVGDIFNKVSSMGKNDPKTSVVENEDKYERISEQLESYIERLHVSPITITRAVTARDHEIDKKNKIKDSREWRLDSEGYIEKSLEYITQSGILPYSYDETTKKLLVLVNRNYSFRDQFSKTIGLMNVDGQSELAPEDSEEYLESLESLFIDKLWEYIPEFFGALMPTLLKDKVKSPRDIAFEYVDKNLFNGVYEYVSGEKSAKKYFERKEEIDSQDDGVVGKNDELKLRDAINKILIYAVQRNASDVHLEYAVKDHGSANGNKKKDDKVRFKVRLRVDGLLQDYPYTIPQDKYEGLINVICQDCTTPLDITKKFLPQDGRIEWSSSYHDPNRVKNHYELRVSMVSEADGNRCVVMRIQQKGHLKKINELGLSPDTLSDLERIAREPHGIILVTGPTGSGKTTTLYAMLNTINNSQTKIITVEDPVEIKMNGIEQIGVNEAVGITFPKLLRTILRRDPDKILIGEIRDAETAQIAIDAANTGHLVLSTLHTNDAPSAIRRLANLKGIDTAAFAESIKAVMGQRLINTFSPPFYKGFSEVQTHYFRLHSAYNEALQTKDINVDVNKIFSELKEAEYKYHHFLKQRGVEVFDAAPELNRLFGKELLPQGECYLLKSPQENFQGRSTITEFWRVGRKAKDLIFNGNFSESEIRKAAIDLDGMKPMVVNGLQKVFQHATTLDKLVHYVGETTFEENRDVIMKYCFNK